jgi:hypothetical protein
VKRMDGRMDGRTDGRTDNQTLVYHNTSCFKDGRIKTDWHGVGRKGGGQLSTNGVKLYSVMSHKFVLGRTRVYIYGGNVEKGGDRTW